MASYGLLQGVGVALEKTADNIGQKLRDDRIHQYKQQLQEQGWDRQDTVRAEDRLHDQQQTTADREHQSTVRNEERQWKEGLLQKEWEREESEEAVKLQREEEQLESHAAYADTAVRDGKQYKVFFNKRGQEIGMVEMGDAAASDKRQYLDPMTASRLNSLDSEITALRRIESQYGELSPEQGAQLSQLIAERDQIQTGKAPQAKVGPPVPGAQQAPDGNWYVQQNGQYYRVD